MKIVKFKKDRFAIANDNGKIIDDCHGYGFKTKEKAHAYGAWKNKTPEQLAKEKAVDDGLKSNKKFSEKYFDEEYGNGKDSGVTNEKPESVSIPSILKELNIECPFTSRELFYGLRRIH